MRKGNISWIIMPDTATGGAPEKISKNWFKYRKNGNTAFGILCENKMTSAPSRTILFLRGSLSGPSRRFFFVSENHFSPSSE